VKKSVPPTSVRNCGSEFPPGLMFSTGVALRSIELVEVHGPF